MKTPDPTAAASEAFVADPRNRAQLESILDDFARVGIERPTRSAIIDVATDAGMSADAAGLVADIIEMGLGGGSDS
jgi:hypothetical protein